MSTTWVQHSAGANAGYTGRFTLRVSGWRESPATGLSSGSEGGSILMRHLLTIVLLSLIFCGCTPKQSSSFDQLAAGRDIQCGTYVLHFDKRDGTSVSGVRLVSREPDGQTATVTADRGSLSQSTNNSAITLVLYDAHWQKGTQKALIHEMTVNLLLFR